DEVGVRSELPENWTSARARASACRAGFAIATTPPSMRLGRCGKPGYQSRFEPTTGTLETFVTLAAIQLAIGRLARSRLLSQAPTVTPLYRRGFRKRYSGAGEGHVDGGTAKALTTKGGSNHGELQG